MPDPAPCDDAARNATPLLSELKRRGARQQVLHYCDIELLKKNFRALMEACKSVFDRLRSISGANGDGAGPRSGSLLVQRFPGGSSVFRLVMGAITGDYAGTG